MVEEHGNPAGLRQALAGEEGVSQEGGRRQGLRCGCPPSPPLYIGARERGEAQHCPFLQGRGAAKRGRSASQVKWRPSPLGFPPSHAHGPWGAGAPGPLRLGHPPYSPCYCIGRGGTFSGPPDPSGILRNLLEASRYNTEKTRTFSGTRTTTFHI